MIVCGVDEAGRGSFVGPLVIAGVAVEESSLPALERAGVRDSKTLTPRARSRLYRVILENSVAHLIRRIRPRTIDNSVLFHGLSDLELDRMAGIVSSIRADAYYVDSCYADEALFGARLAAISGGHPIHSHTRADSRFTVVAAASILAKVARDRSVSNIRRRHPVGSGYPSDSRAAECVGGIYRATGAFPDFARRSWLTACRIAGDQRPPECATGSA